MINKKNWRKERRWNHVTVTENRYTIEIPNLGDVSTKKSCHDGQIVTRLRRYELLLFGEIKANRNTITKDHVTILIAEVAYLSRFGLKNKGLKFWRPKVQFWEQKTEDEAV